MGVVNAVKSQEIKGSEAVLASNILNQNQNRTAVSQKPPDFSLKETVRKEPQSGEGAHREKIERIAQAMDNYMKSVQTDLEIKVHKGTGDIMVKVLAKEDGRVIREIPSEELLNLAAKMESMTGALLNENI
ncbi:flagellar protein FlaG [Thermodesulfobacteriota bacterium]